MADQNVELVACENVPDPVAASLPATQAQAPGAQAFVAQVQALAAQVQVLATQAEELRLPANQAQALALQAQALRNQVQALANQAEIPTAQGQALEASNRDRDVEEAEKSVHAYKEIANLNDINLHYPIHKLALEQWQRKEEYLSNSISRKEGRSAELTNQIYNIIGIFVVIQGVLLIVVSQLTQATNIELPLCGKIWSPIILSLISTLATIVGILLKFRNLKSLEFTIRAEQQARSEFVKRADILLREGPRKFKFHLDADSFWFGTEAKSFWKNLYLLVLFLVIFTCFFIVSYFVILCDTGVVRK